MILENMSLIKVFDSISRGREEKERETERGKGRGRGKGRVALENRRRDRYKSYGAREVWKPNEKRQMLCKKEK